MGYYVVDYLLGGHDQAPGDIQGSFYSTGTPAAAGLADPDFFVRAVCLLAVINNSLVDQTFSFLKQDFSFSQGKVFVRRASFEK